jgi:alpha-tubulin suppressor-like RCC1 family protein
MRKPGFFFTAFFVLLFGASAFAQTAITPASHEVGAEAVPYQILVNSNASWTASVDADWVTLSRTSGSEDGNILVTVAANTTGADRTATITVNSATHALTQRAAGVALQELWAFGSDDNGQLGDNLLTQGKRPKQVTTDVKAVAAGNGRSLILKTDGSLWGESVPQVVNGVYTLSDSPVQILSGGVQAIAAGYYHSLILKTDGSLWGMGISNAGQLGTGESSTDAVSPVQILASGVKAIAAGFEHSLIVKTDGSLWAMGDNTSGELGDGTTTQRYTPVLIISSGVQAVAAGWFHSLIVKTDGSLWAMGSNGYGQLGIGTASSNSPVQVLTSGV